LSDPIATGNPAATGEPGERSGLPAPRSTASEAGITRSAPPSNRPPPDPPATSRGVVQRGDRIFSGLATGSGVVVVVLIGAIGLFLLLQAIPALVHNHANFLTTRQYSTDDPNALQFGILDLLEVTVEVSVYALALAMPVGLGIALFLTQYAPSRIARPLAYLVDLLAAVPSIIFGLWGLLVLVPAVRPIALWLNAHFGWIWLFHHNPANVPISLGTNLFTGGIVLAAMLLPIITAITREVFARTPIAQIEGALALGATKWEVIRTTVLPFGRAGYVSASMLGLGRALGETIALMIILGGTAQAFDGSLFDGGATFASKIALAFADLNNSLSAGAYIAAGLVLFVLTFAVNALARWIVSRGVPES
jgi:phosphate transport system permease protein